MVIQKKVFMLMIIGLLLIVMVQPVISSQAKVNINDAPKDVLVTLKYVGDKLADRIIEHRKTHPFKSPEDLMEVKGVGSKVFEANRQMITTENNLKK